MAKFKRKMRTIIKKYKGDTYRFKNGIAFVPGCYFKGKKMTITINEFYQLSILKR